MRSTLFPYQRRTLARMLQQEISPKTAPDPTYVPIRSITDSSATFYLCPTTLEVRSKPEHYAQTRGGILCEEMGSGKTIITLSLILCTRDELPSTEEHFFHSPPVLTRVSLRYFPYAPYTTERDAAGLSQSHEESPVQLPSLVELAIHRARTAGLPFQQWKDRLEARNLYTPLISCTPFYHRRLPEVVPRGQRSDVPNTPLLCRIYLSCATLLVVPAMLFQQVCLPPSQVISSTEASLSGNQRSQSIPRMKRYGFFFLDQNRSFLQHQN